MITERQSRRIKRICKFIDDIKAEIQEAKECRLHKSVRFLQKELKEWEMLLVQMFHGHKANR